MQIQAEKDVIATKSPFNVVDMKLHWQASGERLAVLLTRYGKKKPMDKGEFGLWEIYQ